MNREERLARNAILFRNVNERIKKLQSDQWGFEEIDFVCECADESKHEEAGQPVAAADSRD